jgi:eukaryotic-like serine/threonine-protein kinase
LIVLPYRLLRPDAEIAFLSFALADAITATLSGLRSIVVRSSLTALRYGVDAPDLKAIGEEAAVDLVLTGTLLRAGERVRVIAQLTEVETGSALWSESLQLPLDDLFQLQDTLTQRVVGSLARPLTARERRLIRRDVPASARAYELYLRGNSVSARVGDWSIGRDLYLAALEEDPVYAPAWVQLGRCHRLLAKYSAKPATARRDMERAEAAFRRALELNPDLPAAHSQYAQFELEGGRPREGMMRLLERAREGAPDAQIFAGLVHALRYCGLLEESLTADRVARRLDPTVATSATFTWLALGRYEEAVATGDQSGGADTLALVALGRTEDARTLARETIERLSSSPMQVLVPFFEAILMGLEGDHAATTVLAGPALRAIPDRESHFLTASWLAHFGAVDESVSMLDGVVDGYYCLNTLLAASWLEPVRRHPALPTLLERAAAGRERSVTSFLELNGPELLAPP